MKKLLFITCLFCCLAAVKANNITITNISVVPASNTIKFDISWDNGWRSTVLNNWDAAWVFFKYKDISGNWQVLALTNTGNVIPGGFTGSVVAANNIPFGGAFLYRSAAGSGTTTLTNVELGITPAQANGLWDIKAFAIEMVYIPQTAFYVGDGASTNSFAPTQITSTATVLTDPIGNIAINETTFPNGYSAFYCMKYELSQGGYRDFLNTLSYNQQVNHIVPAPSAATGTPALYNDYRNFIEIKTAGTASTIPAVFGCDANGNNTYDQAGDGEWVACNYLNWVDHAAYLAWAGLRPLTELEYEKIARGIQNPVAGEYVWGNTQVGNTTYVLPTPNQAFETVNNNELSPIGNANYGLTVPSSPNIGPLRNGIFATSGSDRISSGGSFYGVMELSGNLWERVIKATYLQGLANAIINSNVYLNDNNGYAAASLSSITFWPGSSSAGGVIVINGGFNATGLIYKGGSFFSNATNLRTSDRGGFVISNTNTDRTQMLDVGVRGCRSAN
jgi:formylglycine-generating enzyme required for sulfatase activity